MTTSEIMRRRARSRHHVSTSFTIKMTTEGTTTTQEEPETGGTKYAAMTTRYPSFDSSIQNEGKAQDYDSGSSSRGHSALSENVQREGYSNQALRLTIEMTPRDNTMTQ